MGRVDDDPAFPRRPPWIQQPDRLGGFRIEVMSPPVYQTAIDILALPFSWLSSLLNFDMSAGRDRDTFRVIVRNPRGRWRTLTFASREEAERVREATLAHIERVGIEVWKDEMRGRIPESFFS